MAEALNKIIDWFVNNIGLENMVVFAFVMSVIYLVSLFTRPVVKCVNGFLGNSKSVEGFSNQTIDFESLKNLAVIAEALNSGKDLVIPGNLTVAGKINGDVVIDGNLKVNKDLTVTGTSNLAGHELNKERLIVNGLLNFSSTSHPRNIIPNPHSFEIGVHKGRHPKRARLFARDPEGQHWDLSHDNT